MNNEKRSQIILVSIVIILLGFIVLYSFLGGVKKEDVDSKMKLVVKQIYSSDYELHLLDNEYYFGTYDNKLNVFIDLEGNEVYKTNELISYDNYYKMSDGKYLFYNNEDSKLNLYVFDGKTFSLYHSFTDANYVKPIVCKDVIVGFSSFVDEKLYLYNLNGVGISVLGDLTLVADKFIDNVFYVNNKESLVIKNKEELYGVININGEVILEAKYKDVISLSEDNNYIVKDNNDKYGIIAADGNILLNNKYDGILEYDDYYILIKDKKMALYDKEFNVIIDFKMNYNTLMEFNYRKDLSVKLYNNEDNIVIVNNVDEDKYKREYEYHNMYVIKDSKIVNNIEQISYNNELMYSYDKNYKIKFYDSFYNIINEFKLDNIKKINNIEYLNKNELEIKYLDNDNKEVNECYDVNGNLLNNCDKVILSNSLYYGVVKDKELILYDYDNSELYRMSGNVFKVNKDYIVVDNALYIIIVE